MRLHQLAELRSPEGQRALNLAAAQDHRDLLAASAAIRSLDVAPDLAAAAMTQVELRRRAASKFGADADAMYFTRPGLEQATRRVVADRRAQRLRAAGVQRLADLGCGLGADALAAARAGIAVVAVEADPITAAVAQANVEVTGLAERMTVVCADATTVDLDGYDAVFCDPARRRASGKRVFDPRSYSPPWDFVIELPNRVPRTVLKLAPGIDHARIPEGAEAEWVSVGGALVEAALWCGPLAQVPRRATVLTSSTTAQMTGSGEKRAPVGPVRSFVYDPDGAVIRAYLLAELADGLGANIADAEIAYLYADTVQASPFARCFEVLDVLPFSLKRLRTFLRDRGVGRAEILKRGSALDPDVLRGDLRLSGPNAVTLILTRVEGAQVTLVCSGVQGAVSK